MIWDIPSMFKPLVGLGADYAHHLVLSLPSFASRQHPCLGKCEIYASCTNKYRESK